MLNALAVLPVVDEALVLVIILVEFNVVIAFPVEAGETVVSVMFDPASETVLACTLNTVTPSNSSDSSLSCCAKLEASCNPLTIAFIVSLSASS